MRNSIASSEKASFDASSKAKTCERERRERRERREKRERACGEHSHLHDRIAPFRNRLVALTRALPEALIRNLNAHHQREAEHHAEHVQRIRMVEDAAI